VGGVVHLGGLGWKENWGGKRRFGVQRELEKKKGENEKAGDMVRVMSRFFFVAAGPSEEEVSKDRRI
jgi:hypothetical protein